MTNRYYFYQTIPIQYSLSDQQKEEILSAYLPPTLPESNTEQAFNLQETPKGTSVATRVLLNDFDIKQTKTKKSFLKITFSNQAGNIPAKMWDNNNSVETTVPLLEESGVFDIKGQVDEFNGFKSITIHNISPCKEEIDPFELLAYTKQDLDQLTTELFAYIYELEQPYKTIALNAMDKLWDSFKLSPAAKGFHHNYLGGLLKHTIGLMRFCRYITVLEENPFRAVIKLIHKVETQYKQEIWESLKQDEPTRSFVWKDTIDHLYSMLHGMSEHKYDSIHYDALMTSILFHDIGKLLEYDYAGRTADVFHYLYPTAVFDNPAKKQSGIAMDPLGLMIGHIPYGVLLLNKVIEDNQIAISMEAIHLMSHCILCHHGLPEWGSAVRKPLSLEGYIIHIVDYLDSRYENTESDDEK
ncbi:HD domain-containing protein [Gracilibacillus oryzae]|uniref:HD domain-containing protein n=1 Tax=Gracilibacillus oryzae TaxID=1672701 RepID=A0A7C8GVD3_9BACI|nr:HD domain-containing protein [Gracilibacillus oryzae]KAB8139031.1 HD domain-containing protein [Gracilibacillus oryzae]